jgi:hypothetical protein
VRERYELMPMRDLREYPGLEVIVRKAMDRAKEGLPPDVGVGIMFAFNYSRDPDKPDLGGLAWVAGCGREEAISICAEWLARQVHLGHGDAVNEAMRRWFLGEEQENDG